MLMIKMQLSNIKQKNQRDFWQVLLIMTGHTDNP